VYTYNQSVRVDIEHVTRAANDECRMHDNSHFRAGHYNTYNKNFGY